MNRLILSNTFLNPIKLRYFLKHLTAKRKEAVSRETYETPREKVKSYKTSKKLIKKEAKILYKKVMNLNAGIKDIKKKGVNKKELEKLKKRVKLLEYNLRKRLI